MAMLNLKMPSWFEDAPCSGQNELFFSSHPSDRKKACRLCVDFCPSVNDCLQFAVSENLKIGVWGGKTGPQLERLVKTYE